METNKKVTTKKAMFFIWLLGFLVCRVCFAGGNDSVGNILKIQGSVQIVRGPDNVLNGVDKLPLFPGDGIRTGPDGLVEFALMSGDRYRLAENGEVWIDELNIQPAGESMSIIRLLIGWIRAHIQKSEISETQIYTSTAVIGVRGTEFDVGTELDGAVKIEVDQGAVEIQTGKKTALVTTGMGIRTGKDLNMLIEKPVVPKGKRDWKAWRKNKIRSFVRLLPDRIRIFRSRLEAMTMNLMKWNQHMYSSSAALKREIEKLEMKTRRKSGRLRGRHIAGFRKHLAQFRKDVKAYRKLLNRLRALSGLLERIDRFFSVNREKWRPKVTHRIEKQLDFIRKKRSGIRESTQKTILELKSTIKKIKYVHLKKTG